MPIKGVWRVPYKLASGKVRFYYYTSRHGGVRFWQSDGKPVDEARLPTDFIGAYEQASSLERAPAPGSFGRAVTDYQERSPKFRRMSEKGKRARKRYLDGWLDMPLKKGQRAETAPLAVFDQRGAIKYIIDHRDKSWGHSPSVADEAIFALSAFLNWAKSEGRLDWNRCDGLPNVYERPTEARVWSEDEQLRFLNEAHWKLNHFFRLALFTGLRLSDLVRLPVTAQRAEHILIPTGKSGGKATAIVPIVPPLRKLLADLETKRETFKVAPMTLLFNTRGRSWTADGLATEFYRHRKSALKSDEPPTIHDLRKTAATQMVILQQRFPHAITDQVLCDMFGWTRGTLDKMKRIYVSDAAVIEAMTGFHIR